METEQRGPIQDGDVAVVLREMSDEELDAFVRRLTASAIADLTASGYDDDEAAALAEVQIASVLPDRRPVPEHRICHVMSDEHRVGHCGSGHVLARA